MIKRYQLCLSGRVILSGNARKILTVLKDQSNSKYNYEIKMYISTLETLPISLIDLDKHAAEEIIDPISPENQDNVSGNTQLPWKYRYD